MGEHRKILLVTILLITLLTLSGCSAWTSLKNTVFGTNQEITESKCPICNQTTTKTTELDAVIYYFDTEINQGIIEMIKSSNTFLDCEFTTLQDPFLNEELKRQDAKLDLRIILDQENTMDCTGGTCIPYAQSQYNNLYANGLDIQTTEDIQENFCVNDDGVFIFSKVFDNRTKNNYGLYFQASKLSNAFENRFQKHWKNG